VVLGIRLQDEAIGEDALALVQPDLQVRRRDRGRREGKTGKRKER